MPRSFVDVFEVITDYGRSGWVLFPIVTAMIVLAFGSACFPPGWSRLIIKSISARVWFLFLAVALPGLFTSISKHLIGRARPYVFAPLAWHSEYASLLSGRVCRRVIRRLLLRRR
jgi:hypothetical protein